MDRLRLRHDVRLQKCSGTNLYSCDTAFSKGRFL